MHSVSGVVLHWETQKYGVRGDLLQRCPEDLCYYSNEVASKHYDLLDKNFACHQSQNTRARRCQGIVKGSDQQQQ